MICGLKNAPRRGQECRLYTDCDCPRIIETIRIGDFRLTRMASGGIWIGEADGGEGGQFNEKAIEAAIGKFYAENF